jgi:hypothetical protein
MSSCTRAVSDKSKVTIQFPAASSEASKVTAHSSMVGALATKWQLPAPTQGNRINCYVIAVTLPEGSQPISCNRTSSDAGKADLFFGGFPANTVSEIEIPSGDGREIALVGFETTDLASCVALPETGGAFPVGKFSPPVYLGKVVKDIAPGEDRVDFTVPTDLTTAPAFVFEDCLPKAFASETLITADVTGLPNGSTSQTSIAVTVGGYNVSEYQYAITNGITCAGQSYSTFHPISASISATGLAEDNYRLCVIGKTSDGFIQANPTEKTWTVDTSIPSAATAISLYASVGNLSRPPVTVSGTTVGDTVEIFRGPTPCMNSIGRGTASGTSIVVTPSTAMTEGNNNLVTVQITDAAGNIGPCSTNAGVSFAYNLDTNPPSIPAMLDQSYGTSLFYSPLFTWLDSTDDNSGVDHYEVRIDAGAWINVGLNKYYFTVGSFIETNYAFQVRAIDRAGNFGTWRTETYSVTNSPLWKQQAYGKADNADAADEYGRAIAIDGDFMVVGAPNESSSQTGVLNGATAPSDNTLSQSGAAYVYKRDDSGVWRQTAYLKAAAPAAGDRFGSAVAISKNTIVVGVPREQSTSQVIVNSDTGDSGISSGQQIGAVYVFVYDGTNWKQQSYIKSPNSNPSLINSFGYSVAIDNDILVAGAPTVPDKNTGIFTTPATAMVASGTTAFGGAYIFKRTGTDWNFDAYVKPPRVNSNMRFGEKVSISSQTVVVSAIYEDSMDNRILPDDGFGAGGGLMNGAVYVFENTSGTWKQQAYVKAPNNDQSDYFGWSIDIFEDRLVVSSMGEDENNATASLQPVENDSLVESGAVYVFKRTGTTWNFESYLKSSNRIDYQRFGYSVALWGSTIVVGALGESSCTDAVTPLADSGTTCASTGAAYAFQRDSSNNWNQVNYFKASNNNTTATSGGTYSNYGEVVDISGSTIGISNYREAGDQRQFTNGGTAAPGTGGAGFNSSGSIYIYFP